MLGQGTRKRHLKMVNMQQVPEIALFSVLSALVLSPRIRDVLAFRAVTVYDYFVGVRSRFHLPPVKGLEQILVILGSILLYMNRVKSIRKFPLSHQENVSFFQSLGVGVLLGLFMDLD